jgi:predicted nuclease of predicted toxin-antitoxin system
MFRLYVDEDSGDRNLLQALRARGVDVVTAQEVGMIERTDEEHLQFATNQNRVLYSFNRGDFFRLHSQYLAEGKEHGGLLLARQQHYSVGEQMRRVLKVMALKSAADMRNSVEFLSAWG